MLENTYSYTYPILYIQCIFNWQTTDDLTNLDKKRKEEFKRYEMNKEHEYRDQIKHADKDQAEKLKQEHEEKLKRHKDHPKVNHPVWYYICCC